MGEDILVSNPNYIVDGLLFVRDLALFGKLQIGQLQIESLARTNNCRWGVYFLPLDGIEWIGSRRINDDVGFYPDVASPCGTAIFNSE